MDYLEDGYTVDEFLADFPSVRRAQTLEALDYAKEATLADARTA